MFLTNQLNRKHKQPPKLIHQLLVCEQIYQAIYILMSFT